MNMNIVLLYVYINSTQLSIVEILTTTLGYPNHAGPRSKIVSPCSAQQGEVCLTVSDVGVDLGTIVWGALDAPGPADAISLYLVEVFQ